MVHDVKPETIEALDEMMIAAQRHLATGAAAPKAKPCADTLCMHSRRKHLSRHFDEAAQLRCYEYAACCVPGCRCAGYLPRAEDQR